MFLEEEDLHFFALIDTSASMDFGSPTKLHYAKQLAASLGFIGLCRTDRVRIETLNQISVGRGPCCADDTRSGGWSSISTRSPRPATPPWPKA